VTAGLVDAVTTPMLLRLIEGGRLDPTPFATHRFNLDEAERAYDVFADAATTQALKVVLAAQPVEGRAAGRETAAAAH
jgi:alcohol dehydrogenase